MGSRRERANSSGLADLLAEAMVAFQETQPERSVDEQNRGTPQSDAARWSDSGWSDSAPSGRRGSESGEPRRTGAESGESGRRGVDLSPSAGGIRGRHRSSEWAPADIDSG
ncbi:hypothetical protein [Actinokineospora iranica]|uniref:hypothetical protein n=1 Tax=Actinokineospora iranica TaxID=1271860 RepID=UPI001E371379|nr:hypothetical protein [Actinokineospora iranica]